VACNHPRADGAAPPEPGGELFWLPASDEEGRSRRGGTGVVLKPARHSQRRSDCGRLLSLLRGPYRGYMNVVEGWKRPQSGNR
jgi:hypothetical protein